ncbi:hypothetical protein [Notoacmeibacter sp. MSK16QG-6]|uniref:hypothetical protein n=1 Tax=Notoacmeibacter sp. MSK16QG-6 TaxID=2957982 RepID=UPI00209CD548|nr:hypothetical protein [Notoacmeibacter sp. MSK16QG-6]MCP1200067.1 hypothetical protein [Notoacmeibacter sp. MSK16QG-6]
MTRKRMPIDRLAAWAFREELPKAMVGGSSDAFGGRAMETLAELGTLVDLSNSFGCVPDFSADPGEPHGDAVIFADAVRALRDGEAYLPAIDACDWLADLDGLTGDERSRAAAFGHAQALHGIEGIGLATLIVRQAMLGRAPDWRGVWMDFDGTVDEKATPVRAWKTRPGGRGPVWRRHVVDGAGQTVEVEGYDYRTMRPRAGAWRASELSVDLEWLVSSRMEHDAWGEALAGMVNHLGALMNDHNPVRPVEPKQPWNGASRATVRGISIGSQRDRDGRGGTSLQKSA